jgi:hypothetical protein
MTGLIVEDDDALRACFHQNHNQAGSNLPSNGNGSSSAFKSFCKNDNTFNLQKSMEENSPIFQNLKG